MFPVWFPFQPEYQAQHGLFPPVAGSSSGNVPPGQAASHLDNTCFGTSIHFTERSAGIGADIVTDNIRYAIFDIRLDDISYSGRADCITAGNLGMGKPGSLFFVQFQAVSDTVLKQFYKSFCYG